MALLLVESEFFKWAIDIKGNLDDWGKYNGKESAKGTFCEKFQLIMQSMSMILEHECFKK